MRYLTILLILILGVDVKAQKLTLYTYDDKQLHMGATYVISSFTTAYVFKKTQNKRKAMLRALNQPKLKFKEVPITYVCKTHHIKPFAIFESIYLLLKIRLIKNNYFEYR